MLTGHLFPEKHSLRDNARFSHSRSTWGTRSLLAPQIGTAIMGIVGNSLGVLWSGAVGLVAASFVVALICCSWIYVLESRSPRSYDIADRTSQ
jgi:hypothetical protein